MDPTRQFFFSLKQLAVTLEAEAAQLHEAFENRSKDEGDESGNLARGMRAYHELNSDVGNLKMQIRSQLAEEKPWDNKVRDFIKACGVMKNKLTRDNHAVREHWEKYGYKAPIDTQKPTKAKEEDTEVESADEDETDSADGGEENQKDNEENHIATPLKSEPPLNGVMCTPQLSDFGLSELYLKRTMAGMEWCSEVPKMPEMSLPQPSLETPAPPMPMTPKYALQMDEAELQTPQMQDFGISEHTMCLNNDFTMNLFRKNDNRNTRTSQDVAEQPVKSGQEHFQIKAEELESPEMPVLCTPGLKIKKKNCESSCPEQGSGDAKSPSLPATLHTTPEVPAFQTPYVNRLVSSKKNTQQPEPFSLQVEEDKPISELTTPENRVVVSKPRWEYDVPDMWEMPQMPNLESALGNSLLTKNANFLKMDLQEKLSTVSSLEVDGPTQEFSLGTPRVRTDYEAPTTPEMPDLSSVTQDICKLVSKAQSKKTAIAFVHSQIRSDNNKHGPLSKAASLPMVSESEFQSLPSYLKQMSLSNLNNAVHSINTFSDQHRGEVMELQMEELKRIIQVGTKAPVYILCLAELKRLDRVGDFNNTSVFKLPAHS